MKEGKSMKGKSCHRKNCKMENCVKEKHEWKTRNGKTGSGKTVSSAFSKEVPVRFSLNRLKSHLNIKKCILFLNSVLCWHCYFADNTLLWDLSLNKQHDLAQFRYTSFLLKRSLLVFVLSSAKKKSKDFRNWNSERPCELRPKGKDALCLNCYQRIPEWIIM